MSVPIVKPFVAANRVMMSLVAASVGEYASVTHGWSGFSTRSPWPNTLKDLHRGAVKRKSCGVSPLTSVANLRERRGEHRAVKGGDDARTVPRRRRRTKQAAK